MTNKQSGSVHAVVMVFLVVALIGAVGFIFWQNFISNPNNNSSGQNNSQSQNQDEKQPVDDETQDIVDANLEEYCGEKEKVCFDYPEEWTVSKDVPKGYSVADRVKLTSPDESVIVVFESGLGATGICCGQMPEGPLTVIAKQKLPDFGTIAKNPYLKGSQTNVAYMSEIVTTQVEAKYSNPSDPSTLKSVIKGYAPVALLHTAAKLAKVHTYQAINGGTELQERIVGKYKDQNGMTSFTLTATPQANGKLKTYKTLDDAKSALVSDYFEEAKQILLSARYQ